MKILEIVFSLTSGGAERFVVDLCNRYSKDTSNEIILLTLLDMNKFGNGHYLHDLSRNVRHINTNGLRGYSLKNLWMTYRIIKREKPDVVHAHCGILVLFLPSVFYRKIVYVHTIHSLVQRYSPGKIKTVISRFLYKKGLVIPITISKICHQSYYDFYGLSNDIQIDNGREQLVLTDLFPKVREEIDGYIKKQDTPIFIHVARHHPVKNHERLFKTFEKLEKENVDFQLIVIGDNYGELEKKYRNSKHIHLLGAKNNVGDYMSLADFFVLTSDAEGLPITLLEAMSLGVIPVCTPAGGVVDVIRNGENGFLSKEIDDDMFYDSVCQALNNRQLINKENIINEFKSKYSMETCATRYYKVYQQKIREREACFS